ncbi:MAG: hypothetical protein JNJ88_20085 [Planctomycetes bacterium]|nr:hypothetical protein [Planctomycetota bacterium]
MEYADRRTAELASLEAHRRTAEGSQPHDPAPMFRLGTFAHSLAMELLEESAASYRIAAQRLEASGDLGEAWERSRAMIALCFASLGRAEEARQEVDSVLAQRAGSPSALAAMADLYARRGERGLALEAMDRARAAAPDHPLVTGISAQRGLGGGAAGE